MVREARLIFGLKAAQAVWLNCGLPDPRLPGPVVTEASKAQYRQVNDWLADRIERQVGHREPASRLYMDFARWCDQGNEAPISVTSFGLALAGLGIAKHKNGRIEYLDVRLKD